jgi:hypothetical protein
MNGCKHTLLYEQYEVKSASTASSTTAFTLPAHLFAYTRLIRALHTLPLYETPSSLEAGTTNLFPPSSKNISTHIQASKVSKRR